MCYFLFDIQIFKLCDKFDSVEVWHFELAEDEVCGGACLTTSACLSTGAWKHDRRQEIESLLRVLEVAGRAPKVSSFNAIFEAYQVLCAAVNEDDKLSVLDK